FDRGDHFGLYAVALHAPDLLALADPLAPLRQGYLFDFAHQPRCEIVESDADQLRTLGQGPSVTGVIAKVFRDHESGDYVRLEHHPSCWLRLHFHHRLNCVPLAVEVVDEKKGDERCEYE